MRVRFVGQPFGDATQLGRLLLSSLDRPETTHLWLATAWAKRSGLSRIAGTIQSLRERGGRAEAIIGIDEGGASLEGLELATEVFEPIYVFHDPGPRTFHPKLYVAEDEEQATVVVGSGNLTKGGLFTNYEAALILDLNKATEEDAGTLASIRAFYDALIASGDSCQSLNRELIRHLSAVAVISSEAAQNRGLARRRAQREASIFGTSVTGLAGAPAPQIAPADADDADEDLAARLPAPAEQPDGQLPAVLPEPPGVSAIWWKRLSASDAQHPPQEGSAPTGNLRLSKAGHPIDWRTYFRRDFFGRQTWQERTVSGRPAEETSVPFHVTLDGVDAGLVQLRIDHAPHREADQNNVPTVLHWGDLGEQLRRTDYTGFYVVLTLFDDGTYSLEIARSAPPRVEEP